MYLMAIGTLFLVSIIKFFKSLDLWKYLKKIIQNYSNKKVVKKESIDLAKIEYHPITCKAVIVNYDRLKTKLIEKGYEDCPFIKNFNDLMIQLPEMFEMAEKRCCAQIRANGYFTIFRILSSLLEFEYQRLNSLDEKKFKQEVDYLNETSNLFLKLIEICLLMAKDTDLEDEETKKRLDEELSKNYPGFYSKLKTFKQVRVKKNVKDLNDNLKSSIHDQCYEDILINNNSINNLFVDNYNDHEFNSLPLFTPHMSTNFIAINEAINRPNTPNRHLIIDRYFLFWLSEDVRSIFKALYSLPFLRVPFHRYFQLIFSSDYRAEIMDKILCYPTLNFPLDLFNLIDSKIFRLYINYLTRNTSIKSEEIFIPTQNSIVINESAYDRLTINDKNEIKFKSDRKIRCKYITPKNIEIGNCSKLILHYHGGAFLSLSVENNEIFLRGWVDCNKIPILSVDYKVKECFPSGLKDCFDVYLWLRMAPEQEIRTKLGFFPEQIVLIGDSAGGNLALGVVLVLNDLRIDYADKFKLKIPMVNGLVPFYAPFLLNFQVCPSRAISSIDPFLNPGIQFMVVQAVTGQIQGLKPSTLLRTVKHFLFPSSDPMLLCFYDQNEFKKQFDSTSRMVMSPFFNSLIYEKYDTLIDVPIHIISAEFCSLLDDSITMAKIWKGRIKIDVLPQMFHAFLQFNFFDKDTRNATMYCGQKIAEMFK